VIERNRSASCCAVFPGTGASEPPSPLSAPRMFKIMPWKKIHRRLSAPAAGAKTPQAETPASGDGPGVALPVFPPDYQVMCSTAVNLIVEPSAKCNVPAASCDSVILPSPWLTTCPDVKVAVQSVPCCNGAEAA
jgi:hypothetical protein